ncbi:MAG: hypothetical protein K6F84_04460 [Lachnospiraceae bacterium]|nr:hypothetical protein [Lachnospiraceae bacterium]
MNKYLAFQIKLDLLTTMIGLYLLHVGAVLLRGSSLCNPTSIHMEFFSTLLVIVYIGLDYCICAVISQNYYFALSVITFANLIKALICVWSVYKKKGPGYTRLWVVKKLSVDKRFLGKWVKWSLERKEEGRGIFILP